MNTYRVEFVDLVTHQPGNFNVPGETAQEAADKVRMWNHTFEVTMVYLAMAPGMGEWA